MDFDALFVQVILFGDFCLALNRRYVVRFMYTHFLLRSLSLSCMCFRRTCARFRDKIFRMLQISSERIYQRGTQGTKPYVANIYYYAQQAGKLSNLRASARARM